MAENIGCQKHNQRTRREPELATIKKSTKEANSGKAETKRRLDELIQQGARQMIQQAVEAELATMLEQYSNVKSIDGRRAVVRNGYLPRARSSRRSAR